MRRLLPTLLLFLAAIPATAAPLHDLTPQDFTRLGARPLGMGGAWTAYASDEQAVFHNPATLASQKLPRIGTSHSARHFPGPVERDQLDADPTALIWPMGLGLTIGHGWITQGELGYAHHDLTTDPAFPRQHLWGKERVDAVAWDALLLKVGVAHREQGYRYASLAADAAGSREPALDAPTLVMEGEGTVIGALATVFPGVRYGWMQEKLDQDYLPTGAPAYGSTRTLESSGWAVSPAAWLTFAWQTDRVRYKLQENGVKRYEDGPITHRSGGELLLGGLGALRWGAIEGTPTWGATLFLGGIHLHWGEAAGQMPRIVQGEWPAGTYEDTHHYSWSVGL